MFSFWSSQFWKEIKSDIFRLLNYYFLVNVLQLLFVLCKENSFQNLKNIEFVVKLLDNLDSGFPWVLWYYVNRFNNQWINTLMIITSKYFTSVYIIIFLFIFYNFLCKLYVMENFHHIYSSKSLFYFYYLYVLEPKIYWSIVSFLCILILNIEWKSE